MLEHIFWLTLWRYNYQNNCLGKINLEQDVNFVMSKVAHITSINGPYYMYTVFLPFQVDTLDETNMKKLLLQFEKRVYKNQEMRIKFPDMPEK